MFNTNSSNTPLLTIRKEREYNAAVKRLNELLDEIGDDEKHPLYSLLDTLGTLIRVYEEEYYPIPEAIEFYAYLPKGS